MPGFKPNHGFGRLVPDAYQLEFSLVISFF